MATKVGTLIKQARTEAGLTQEQLARKIKGITANDISRAERGEIELTQAVLKEIAKITGVTQSSLINAAKKKTTTTNKKKTTTSKGTSMKLTAAEKKLVELYRAADTQTKKSVIAKLKGESTLANELLETLIGNAFDMLSNGTREMPETEETDPNAIPFELTK